MLSDFGRPGDDPGSGSPVQDLAIRSGSCFGGCRRRTSAAVAWCLLLATAVVAVQLVR